MTMQKDRMVAAQAVVEEFLVEHDEEPTRAEWKQLVAQHPELASEIAEAAMFHLALESLQDSDVSCPVNKAAYDSSVSAAINLLHTQPSPVLTEAAEKVAAVQGAAVRKLCAQVGLGAHVALLSGVLVGAIRAPVKLIERLSQALAAPAIALKEFFAESFERRQVPAYKAEAGKPVVNLQPTPWAEAVRALKLSPEETSNLLALDD